MYTFIILLAMHVGNMKWILCTDWQSEWARWANLAHSGLPSLILCKKKWTYKVSNFCIMSVIKLQEAAEDSQNQKKSNLLGFIVLWTQLAFFLALKINKSFLILIKANIMFSYIINPLLLTRLVQLRWLDINFNWLFFQFL